MNDFSFYQSPDEDFPEQFQEKLLPFTEEVCFPRGHVLFNRNSLERNLYIMRKGIARAYLEVDGKEVTIWFGLENDVIISAQGYVYGKRGYETMELLEDSTLYKIGLNDLMQLYRTDIDLANWGRRLMEREFVKTEQRLIYNLSLSATERYLLLLQDCPELFQRVQLQHVASFLGISPESLSRIRNGLKSR